MYNTLLELYLHEFVHEADVMVRHHSVDVHTRRSSDSAYLYDVSSDTLDY